MSDTVKVSASGGDELETFLSQIDRTLRGTGAKKALRAAGQVVRKSARSKVSKPGYPGDKADKESLYDSIKVVVRDYGETFVTVVGPTWPAGAHGHLVEFGHQLVAWGHKTDKRVAPYPFLRPAADQTTGEQQATLVAVLQTFMPSAG